MAWVTPRSWTPGELVTAGMMNTHVRDNLNALYLSVNTPNVCQGRLTLTTGLPVTIADVTGATTIYFTPYMGNKIALYDGAAWAIFTLTERSIALGTLTAALPYDVFIYSNAGTLTLEVLAWTNVNTRATNLVFQDGIYVKTGATTRRYLGTFYTTATTTTEDSFAKRLLWNYYNRLRRPLRIVEATDSWTYTTATFRQARASTANQVAVVIGVSEVFCQYQHARAGRGRHRGRLDHGDGYGLHQCAGTDRDCQRHHPDPGGAPETAWARVSLLHLARVELRYGDDHLVWRQRDDVPSVGPRRLGGGLT
jgi:hypothetical protein